jgi:hypothetical protein
VLLWKDWNLDFVPRLGTAEFERVRNTLHDQGMRLIVYTSPFYFLKGTSQEKQAVNDKPGVCPGAIANGENMPLFLDAIRRVMRDLKPDGLYFDGQYIENPAALYALARESRRVVGEKGLLEWHSTAELGPWGSRMYMPHADAYTDFQLRGEGQDAIYDDFDYLRFFVSGYNVSNAVGVLCNNSGKPMTRPMLESLWNANVRLHTIVGNPARDIIQKEHRPHLTPQYQADVDREVLRRQERVPEKFATAEAFERGPTWKEPPLFAAEFDAMPAGETLVSEANPKDALRIQDGCLHLQAKASTYAFVRIPLNRHVTGFVVKVRQGSDQGASWGPAAMVRWANGGSIRVGSRSDGVQADVFGDQRLGPAQDPQAWVWLRARWNGTECLAEISRDGVNYQRFATYHRLIGKDVATELLIGKAPFHGQAKDYDVAGPIGECDIDFVRVYGSP